MQSAASTLLIRADAGNTIGAGHVMRCLALAQGWRAAGREALFLTASDSEALYQRLAHDGQRVVALSDPDDGRAVAEALASYPDAWVVLDGYRFGTRDQQRLRDAGHRLLVLDDLAHLDSYEADVIVNPNLGAQALTYRRPPATRLLRGPEFVLLRQEFLSHQRPRGDVPQRARRVLVTLGGADPDNVTLTLVRSLQLLKDELLEVVVVLGASYRHFDSLQAVAGGQSLVVDGAVHTSWSAEDAGSPFTILRNPVNMAGLMAWADIVLSAGGGTVWELLFMGAPTLTTVLAPNQQPNVDGLSALGVVVSLGDGARLNPEQVAQAVHQLQGDRRRRQSMRAAGQALVDGRGVQRIIAAMDRPAGAARASLSVQLRPAALNDAPFLWRLANDPTVRAMSFNHDPIPYEGHLAWLAAKAASPDTRLWIAEIDGQPAGQIRYQRQAPDVAEVSFSVAAELRGRGLGAQLLLQSGERACRELDVRRLRGRLFSDNAASARAFIKAGYQLIETFKSDQRPCQTYERACGG